MNVTNYTAAGITAPDGSTFFRRLRTRNGNFFSGMTDTLGRVPLTTTTNAMQFPSDLYDILNSQGTTSRVTVTTTSISVNTAFGQPG